MKILFKLNTNPNDKRTFQIPKINSEYMGKLSLRWFGPVLWDRMLPEKYKGIVLLEKFKEVIKRWIPENCPCRLCKNYIASVGFIDTLE